jgi:type IV pilus assembly protein PilN
VIRINLLPHREEKRKALRQQFYALSGLIAVLAILIVILVHGVIAGYIGQQEGKNEFLKKEIAALDKEIDEIKRLKEQTNALLSRKGVIESLQGSRAETVQLFNELARQVPAGIYLKSLKQSGNKIGIVGVAQSNARVSTLMRNLEASPLLERPDLVEIKAVIQGNRRYAEFNLNVIITRAAAATDKKPAAGGQPPKQDKKA